VRFETKKGIRETDFLANPRTMPGAPAKAETTTA